MGGQGRGGDETTQWRGQAPSPVQTDPETFAATFRAAAPALHDFLARLSGRVDLADALLRQTASSAAMAAAGSAQWPSARAWLFSRALTVVPTDGGGTNADLASFIALDYANLPPTGAESGVGEMARAVWRSVGTLPRDEHALLHLHIREAMVAGEAASVLGLTEREAADRLARLIPAVERAARALFLIRFGRGRDPGLDDLLRNLNVNRLTAEARASIEEYAATSRTAKAFLADVPPPLAVYAALRVLAPPSGLVNAAAAAALPWLASASATTVQPVIPADATTALPDYGYGQAETTAAPQIEPRGYGAYGQPPPPPPAEISGTQMLDIPVRQRVVREEAVFVPRPRPAATRSAAPVALLLALGGALVLIVGALVVFVVRGDTGTSTAVARATATLGGGGTSTVQPSPTLAASPIAPALLTATALATQYVSTPTSLPSPTPGPLAPITSGSVTTGSATAGAATPSVNTPSANTPVTGIPSNPGIGATASAAGQGIATVAPLPPFMIPPVPAAPPARVTQAPNETPTPRVTAAPTFIAPTATKESAPTTAPTAAIPTARATATSGGAAPTTVLPTAAPTTGATSGKVTANKGSLALGSGKTSDAVTLSNGGVSPANYTASANVTWLIVSPASGTIAAGGTAPLTVTVNAQGLTSGSYSGTVTIQTPTGAQTVTVTFNVAAVAPA